MLGKHIVKTRTILLCAGITIAGCDSNNSGNVAATAEGDMSRVAERRSPIESLVSACGEPEVTEAGRRLISRQPYLQQVTATSAMVGFVMADGSDASVTVTTPDGKPVLSTTATPETTVVRRSGERQQWARLGGLAPATLYCYAVRDARGLDLMTRAGFRTAPSPDSKSVRFLAMGDSGGGGSDQKALLAQMFTVPYDLIIHTGDIAYDSGTISEFEDNVFSVYNRLFRHLPFFPVSGNHEYETDDARPYRDVFALPSNERWFSYDWGNVHFAAIDTEQDYAVQARWLDEDLAKSSQPWKIVYMHRPPYASSERGSDLEAREAFAPIFEKHGVKLVLTGHEHHYERTKPQRGVHYIVTGGGGQGTRAVTPSSFTAFAQEVIHFVYVDVGPDELTLYAIDGTGAQFDSLTISR